LEIEIGRGKSGRKAYRFADVSIVPSRRTRDPEDVDISWEIDAYRFELPLMAAPMDGVVSPATAIEIGRLGGVGVLNLEGLWCRYEDPEPYLQEIAGLAGDAVTARMQQIYAEPVKPELIKARIAEVKAAGAVACGSLTPQRTVEYIKTILEAELDLFVVQGTVVSAEHVSRSSEPLNLKKFIRELDIPVVVGGCSSYQTALHLMRTGAVGVLVGVCPGDASSAPATLGVGVAQATAVADARAARAQHLDETGVYVHVIADGGMVTGGDVAKAIVCGADAVMLGTPLARAAQAPGRGWNWGMGAHHASLPRGWRVPAGTCGTMEQVLHGPARSADGSSNIFGALRTSMAMCGYQTLKEFQKAELVVARSDAGGGTAVTERTV
jgi:IMP dehydrogenase